jgi:hypothetical protein
MVDSRKAPRGILLPALVSLRAEQSAALPHLDREHNISVKQVDAELVDVAGSYAGCHRVELRIGACMAEGNVRNIVHRQVDAAFSSKELSGGVTGLLGQIVPARLAR